MPTLHGSSGLTEFGRVVRGPRRELMSPAAIEQARSWGLKSVVDIRNDEEVGARDGDPVLTNDAWRGISIAQAPTEDQSHPEFVRHCLPILDSPAYWEHNVRILPQMIAGALRAIIAAKPGVLVHCAAGRDRTGLIATLLLANAGVPAEAISADYAVSVRALAGASHHGGPNIDRQSGWNREQTEEFLDRVVPVVETEARRVGTTLDALEISADERLYLRDLLVASSPPA